MVGAAEAGSIAAALGNGDAAMKAHVGEGADRAATVPGDDQGLVEHAEREVFARVLDLLDAADAEPVGQEDSVLLLRQDVW